MFDDSKRLEQLESRMSALEARANNTNKALNDWTTKLEAFDEGIRKRHDDAVNQTNENNKALKKRFEALEKSVTGFDGDIKKLQQRCANLESAVKNLGK